MDESDQKRKIRSMEVVSFYYDTTESHSAACEAIHVCGIVHTGEQIRKVTMESWIQDPRVLEQSWTALSTQRGIPWTLHDKIRSFFSECDAASRARVDWRWAGVDRPAPFHKKGGHPRKEVFAGAPAADGRQAPEIQTREREAGAPPTLMRPGCTGSAAQGAVSEVESETPAGAAAPVPLCAPAAAGGAVVPAFDEAERCHAAAGAYLSQRLWDEAQKTCILGLEQLQYAVGAETAAKLRLDAELRLDYAEASLVLCVDAAEAEVDRLCAESSQSSADVVNLPAKCANMLQEAEALCTGCLSRDASCIRALSLRARVRAEIAAIAAAFNHLERVRLAAHTTAAAASAPEVVPASADDYGGSAAATARHDATGAESAAELTLLGAAAIDLSRAWRAAPDDEAVLSVVLRLRAGKGWEAQPRWWALNPIPSPEQQIQVASMTLHASQLFLRDADDDARAPIPKAPAPQPPAPPPRTSSLAEAISRAPLRPLQMSAFGGLCRPHPPGGTSPLAKQNAALRSPAASATSAAATDVAARPVASAAMTVNAARQVLLHV
jgi:hypothetical protein